ALIQKAVAFRLRPLLDLSFVIECEAVIAQLWRETEQRWRRNLEIACATPVGRHGSDACVVHRVSSPHEAVDDALDMAERSAARDAERQIGVEIENCLGIRGERSLIDGRLTCQAGGFFLDGGKGASRYELRLRQPSAEREGFESRNFLLPR